MHNNLITMIYSLYNISNYYKSMTLDELLKDYDPIMFIFKPLYSIGQSISILYRICCLIPGLKTCRLFFYHFVIGQVF